MTGISAALYHYEGGWKSTANLFVDGTVRPIASACPWFDQAAIFAKSKPKSCGSNHGVMCTRHGPQKGISAAFQAPSSAEPSGSVVLFLAPLGLARFRMFFCAQPFCQGPTERFDLAAQNGFASAYGFQLQGQTTSQQPMRHARRWAR